MITKEKMDRITDCDRTTIVKETGQSEPENIVVEGCSLHIEKQIFPSTPRSVHNRRFRE